MDEPQPTEAPERRDETRGHVPADDGAPTESLVAAAVGDRCVNCGSPLSSDQRYCVVCGERRGAPRFVLPTQAATAAAGDPAPVAATRPPRSGPRLGIGVVIAGVATLLLAMLVGVLIGHNTASNPTRTVASAPVRIIKVGGGSTAPASSSASGSGATSGSAGSSGGHHASAKAKPKAAKSAKAPAVSKKAAAKEQSAASKVLGGKNTPPATVTVGQSGTGKGYDKKTHKFNGSFFGQ